MESAAAAFTVAANALMGGRGQRRRSPRPSDTRRCRWTTTCFCVGARSRLLTVDQLDKWESTALRGGVRTVSLSGLTRAGGRTLSAALVTSRVSRAYVRWHGAGAPQLFAQQIA